MAQQQIITKPYVEELQDNDSLFINHDGALRQIKKNKTGFATKEDLEGKVDKETGKGLSTNDYTNVEKSKLADLENYDDAEVRGLITGLQTSKVDKTDLTKTDRRLNALYELTQGQAWDFDRDNNNAYSVDVPSGSKYVSVDMVGGHSEVIDGEIISSQTDRMDIVGKNLFDNRDVTVYLAYLKDNDNDIAPSWQYSDDSKSIRVPCEPNTAYTISLSVESTIFRIGSTPSDLLPLTWGSGVPLTQRLDFPKSKSATITTGESDKYLIVQIGFSTMDTFISDGQIEKGSTATEYKPYSLQQITTGFPALNSAGSVYDYIDINEGKLYTWTYIEDNEVKALTEPIITDIAIPSELTEWLEVEAGGSITFHNADEGKRLLIPSTEEYLVKLSEVVSNG